MWMVATPTSRRRHGAMRWRASMRTPTMVRAAPPAHVAPTAVTPPPRCITSFSFAVPATHIPVAHYPSRRAALPRPRHEDRRDHALCEGRLLAARKARHMRPLSSIQPQRLHCPRLAMKSCAFGPQQVPRLLVLVSSVTPSPSGDAFALLKASSYTPAQRPGPPPAAIRSDPDRLFAAHAGLSLPNATAGAPPSRALH
jgi:hypothetical protein